MWWWVVFILARTGHGLMLEVSNVTDRSIEVTVLDKELPVVRQGVSRIYELSPNGVFYLHNRTEFLAASVRFANLRPETFYVIKFTFTGTVSQNQQTAPVNLSIAERTLAAGDYGTPRLSAILGIAKKGDTVSITVEKKLDVNSLRVIARPEVSDCEAAAEFDQLEGDYLAPRKTFVFNVTNADKTMPRCNRICIQHFIELSDPESSAASFVEMDRYCENFTQVVAEVTNRDPEGAKLNKVVPNNVDQGTIVPIPTTTTTIIGAGVTRREAGSENTTPTVSSTKKTAQVGLAGGLFQPQEDSFAKKHSISTLLLLVPCFILN